MERRKYTDPNTGRSIIYGVCGLRKNRNLLIFNAVGRKCTAWREFCELMSRDYYILCLDMDVNDIETDYINTLCGLYKGVIEKEKIRNAVTIAWCSGLKLMLHMMEAGDYHTEQVVCISPDLSHLRGKENVVSEYEKNIKVLGQLAKAGKGDWLFSEYQKGRWGENLDFDSVNEMARFFDLFNEIVKYDYSESKRLREEECLCINGNSDPISGARNRDLIREIFLEPQMLNVDNVGHHLFLEQPLYLRSAADMFFNGEKRQASWLSNDHKLIVDSFRHYASENPSKILIDDSVSTLSYSEADARSTLVGRRLLESGVDRNMTVVICIDKSCRLVVVLLAAMKIGAPFMVINSELSDLFLSECDFSTVNPVFIYEQPEKGEWLERYKSISVDELLNGGEKEEAAISKDRRLRDVAMYSLTSGSTGRSKMVPNQQFDFCMLMEHLDTVEELRACSSIYMMVSPAFNFGMESLLYTLYAGKTLYFRKGKYTIAEEFRYIAANGIEVVYAPGELMKLDALVGVISKENLRFLRCIIVGGSSLVLKKEVAAQLQHHKIKLINDYGISEYLTLFMNRVETITDGSTNIAVGYPIKGVEACILDEKGEKITDAEQEGTLYIAKADLRREDYFPSRIETAETVFLDGKLFFNTKDLAYFDAEGKTHILGRTDNCLKIRGKRIYTEELENRILSYLKLEQICILTEKNGGTELVAVYASKHPLTENEIIRKLEEYLPDYMIPRIWVESDAISMNVNSKIDRNEVIKKRKVDREIIRSLNIEEIREHFAGRYKTSLTDLGIDSLERMAVLCEVEERTGKKIKYADIETVEGLIRVLRPVAQNVSGDTSP